MYKRRKDNKGRVLQTGESQRKDLIYQYRYTDLSGKRQTVYAPTLNELREKEKEIQKKIDSRLDYAAGKAPVYDLVARYISLRGGLSVNTIKSYNAMLKKIKDDDFMYLKISDVKKTDAKQWGISLYNRGVGSGTIKFIFKILKASFKMAYDDDLIIKNPFEFRLNEVIPDNVEHRTALTPEQQDKFLKFLKADKTYNKYFDMITVFLETGIRVSELCGLTLSDVDLDNGRIKIDHQLLFGEGGNLYTTTPKTKSGIRYIPLSDKAYRSLESIIENRQAPQAEVMIDGYIGFVFINKNGNPRTAKDIQTIVRNILNKYNKTHPECPLPKITPHILRHTFCTNMVNLGVDTKSVQYLMGHANITTTLDIYAHATYESVCENMAEVLKFERVNVV